MPPRPTRNNNIRNVESGDIEARPRDAALRKAANERASAYIRQIETERDINQPNSHPTVSQDFNQYADERAIQSTNATGSGARGVNTQYRNGAIPNNTRRIQTETRVPSTRKTRTKGRPSFKRALPNVPVLDVNPVVLARATTVSVTNITWGIGLWAAIQLPLAIMSLIFFGATYIVKDVIPAQIKSITGETLYNVGESIASTFTNTAGWLLEKIFGFNLIELLKPENYFVLTHMLVFVIGFATLILMGIIYQISLINCVFGKHSALKITTLVFASFAYMVPLLNLIPWFIFWVLVVWRYPE
ncbi:MAG: hypothetical protein KBC62_03925 [Candidatus Pacebacteria bacterium]|nr:hypothetical protein [Candidatus Paceibacterota bacterium]